MIAIFEKEGNQSHVCPGNRKLQFTHSQWGGFSEKEKSDVLMLYRLAYCGIGEVNWCEALVTVLANDEVINGVSERGGHPVVKKKLRQWYLRITEYAERLLGGLETVDFSDSMKEMQSNWIGKSFGAEIDFEIVSSQDRRAKLITSAKSFLTQYNMAGIDIDWEFPCSAPRDKQEEYKRSVQSRAR